MKQFDNETTNILFINTDGGSRGNPGEAAIGVVFSDAEGKELHTYQQCIGIATNNEAEYRAIITALELLTKSQWFSTNNISNKKVICRLDSQLVVEQINGNYKIKQDHLRILIGEIRQLIEQIHLNVTFIHIPREQNKRADKLVNLALDEKQKTS